MKASKEVEKRRHLRAGQGFSFYFSAALFPFFFFFSPVRVLNEVEVRSQLRLVKMAKSKVIAQLN